LSKLIPQLIRTFATQGLGASEQFVWRIKSEPVYSELGSPVTPAVEPIDTVVWGIYGTSTMDDKFDQSQSGGRMSPGKEIVHLRPDISLYHGQRTLLAGDEFFRYANLELDIIVAGAQTKAYIATEASNIVMVMTYDNVTQLLTNTDYTYDPISGTVVFSISIPATAVIACSYYHDKYIIEDVNNYGKVYIEVMLNKISRT